MVRVTDELALSADSVVVYHTSDPLLGHLPILIFHGASTTSNYTLSSSRVQVHVFTPAGLQSFHRLTISPDSPFYAAVNHLSREFQGDEIYRGLAFGLSKYFAELPDGVKSYLKNAYPTRGRPPGSPQALFGEQHVADLVQAMVKSDNTPNIIAALESALQTQHISNIDVDFILPPGAIVPLQPDELEQVPDNEDDMLDPTLRQYGGYTPLVRALGQSIFLPTTRLRRAPSKPTALNKTKSFSVEQKVDLRMKLAELVDTEERYVLKLNELVHTVVPLYKEAMEPKAPDTLNAAERELDSVFPRRAEDILTVNSGFLGQLRKIMDDSEDDAIRDMESTTTNYASNTPSALRPRDPTGALEMAKLFLEWFPKFDDCYKDYIRASRHFPTILNGIVDKSTARQRVNPGGGEQSTRSTLIEPVQRLPRYSLLIDQIVSCLPMTHPALQSMLRARDIITNICSLDDPSADKPQVVNRLRSLVEAWPIELEPQGRFITAADFLELSPPYQMSLEMTENAGTMLLFTDCIIVLKKLGGAMCARDLLREVDKPSATELLISMTNAAGGEAAHEFAFTGWHNLADVRFTESTDGNLTWMTSTQAMKGAHPGEHKVSKSATSRCFLLQDSFEGKASKWGEDVVKARIEARFSESEREDPCWTLRAARNPDTKLGIHAAVFQEGADQLVEGRKEPAAVRVVIDHERGTKGAPVGHYGVEIVIAVDASDMKRLSVTTVGLKGSQHQDEVAVEDFLLTVTHRIVQHMSIQFNASNRQLTAAMVSYYTKVLRSLSFTATATRAEKTRSFLNASPVKLISSLWNSGSAAATPDSVVSGSSKQARQPSLHRSNSFHSIQGSIRGRDDRSFVEEGLPDNPLMRLEQTFSGYITALESRQGAVQGRALLNRHNADEVLVNDLYNRLIETPFDIEIAPDVNINIIFVAFENFLRIAWKEQMGAVITMHSLDTLQDRAHRRAPGDFADFVHYLFADMAPQNRRAFGNIIKLLANLLNACDNDGDRGALTLAFAELLVNDRDAPNYINLLDRLVEECPRIFGSGQSQNPNFANSVTGSVHSNFKDKSLTGSVTSNASSLRRKFGLDMLLKSKEKDDKQERPSVWRSLSKHRNPATGEASSISKGTMNHMQAVDDNSLQRRLQRRHASPTRPPVAGAFDDPQRPVSSHRMEFPLNTIGEPSDETARKTSKKKRRSSLSDLKTLMAAASIEDEPLPALQDTRKTSEKLNSGAVEATPIKVSAESDIHPSFRVPQQKENIENLSANASPAGDGAAGQRSPSKNASRNAKALSVSSIPNLKPGNTESGADASKIPVSPTRTAPKLRLQSPQKLRDRLQTEKKAAEEAGGSLQAELFKIGNELSRVKDGSNSSSEKSEVQQVAASVKALEEKIPWITQDMQSKHDALQKEMETTVRAAEAKLRAIDQLHKEVTAENELLYEKFNEELGKIVKALRGKGKEEKEELMTKLKEQSDESARLKKDNMRLKREIVSLKTALKGGDQ